MPISSIKCECCKGRMLSDFSNNTWCDNDQCLLHDKCFSHDFLEGREQARINKEPVQQKERMFQGTGFDKCK
jgi:hypothetical protein